MTLSLKQDKQSGFTLIELMVVMAIIAILATAGLSAYTNYIDKALITKGREFARVVETNLVGQLALQINCDGNTNDSSGTNKTITGTVTQYSEGISGQGCNLKGKYLSTNSTGLSSTTFTLSFWVRLESDDGVPSGSAKALITYMNHPNGGFSTGIQSTGKLVFQYLPSWTSIPTQNKIPLKKWTHISITHNGTQTTIYLNGVQNAQASHTYIPTTTHSLFINNNWGAYYPDSTYDDVRFYTSSLLVGDIEKIYRESASRYLARK